MQFVFDSSRIQRYQFPTHTNDLVLDRSQAQTSEVFLVVLDPGQAPPLHRHDDTEQIFYVLEGQGNLTIVQDDEAKGQQFALKSGDVVRIPPSTLHSIEADAGMRLRYLVVDCFVAGRPQDEPTWDAHVRVMCRQQGWDYETVRNGASESGE